MVDAGYSMDSFKIKADVPLCQKAFTMITGLSIRSLQRHIRFAKLDLKPRPVGRKRGMELSKTEAARAWLRHYASVQDQMPNSSIKGRTEVRR